MSTASHKLIMKVGAEKGVNYEFGCFQYNNLVTESLLAENDIKYNENYSLIIG